MKTVAPEITGRKIETRPASVATAVIESPDMTVAEVAAYRRESPTVVQRKMRSGVYVSYRNGDRRLITRESVLADRARCLAEGPQFGRDSPRLQKLRPRESAA